MATMLTNLSGIPQVEHFGSVGLGFSLSQTGAQYAAQALTPSTTTKTVIADAPNRKSSSATTKIPTTKIIAAVGICVLVYLWFAAKETDPRSLAFGVQQAKREIKYLESLRRRISDLDEYMEGINNLKDLPNDDPRLYDKYGSSNLERYKRMYKFDKDQLGLISDEIKSYPEDIQRGLERHGIS